MHDSAFLVLCATCLIAGLFVILGGPKARRFPPGPKGLPIVGNLLDIPRDYPWLTYTAWGRRYGSELIHFEALGQHFVVVNSTKVAKVLFDGRSQIYSDRTLADCKCRTGFHRNFAIMPYGEGWRERRRLFHQYFRSQAIDLYHNQMMKGARDLVQLLLDSPDNFLRHIRHTSGATVLDIIYGMDVDPSDDQATEIVDKAIEVFTEIADAGGYLVDLLPPLKYLPTWFPGAGFKRQASLWKQQVDRMYEMSYREVESAARRNKARPCVASNLISKFWDSHEDPDVKETLISVTGTAYSENGLTLQMIFTIIVFVLAMLLHPEAQRKAQEELDRVVGRDRLPEMTDRESLPYITAMIKELLRWHTIVPSGAIHKSIVDDWYDGYYIPAGTIVIGNAWAILHDEKQYLDPEAFKPERFLTPEGALNPSVPDPIEAFGFGRRICPGRYFAQAAVFLYISHILSAFTITKPVDELGNIIEPTRECIARLFYVPKPFKASIKPRFEGAEELIRSSSVYVD
ncbi:uncharacterized protein PHACADRAFT_144778 [Phanerochaete carnosa HHB-10118-sp]|uniref:Cytochrome P450 n=1 Tax=Phanerochaete carnosa (strain HHB-10118-sp) TaxID=650164 RepID=K5VWG4_PHACS|nr:uncharacterized protein PHACADRAFT_144778 [Phanerochaete carnosa HHB-10118-sp]EKM55883.1 hypothetical protein PHACADRAFT_144778 [Phanerochaete carnosa HHB-10118-sp]